MGQEPWDGITERRSNQRSFCPEHSQIHDALIELKIFFKGWTYWRGTLVGFIGVLLMSIFTAIYSYGSINKQVEINTDKWKVFETCMMKVISSAQASENITNNFKLNERLNLP